MDESGETDQATVLNNLRGLIETVNAGGVGAQEDQQQQPPAVLSESVAQLIAAALSQVSQTILNAQGSGDQQDNGVSQQLNGAGAIMTAQDTDLAQVEIQTATGAENVESIIEIASSGRRKPICVKFPTEMRKKIIDMRKEGRKYKAIAKELGVSVSGVQKVWERFLATGLIHDRKPSTYAGRPRKFSLYSSNEEESSTVMSSPLYLAAGTSDGETEGGAYTNTELSTPSRAVLVPSHDGEVFHEEPMDAPGAMVEVVASTTPTTTPTSSLELRRGGKKTVTHDYRKTLLLRLIEDCPLAMLMSQTDSSINPHVTNIAASVAKPLYMEYVLGHPFGKVPSPRPFDGSVEDSEVILSDPCNPLGKEMLTALGYSTKVHFNACCKPSPLFDPHKVLTKLPFSIGPGHLADTLQVVLQTLLDLCLDPVAALELIPAAGVGPLIVAHTSDGDVASKHIIVPSKLSEYWLQLYEYSNKLQCCENFFSATQPSVPCLICHPFESFAHNLQIKDPSPPPSPSVAHESSCAPPVITLNLTNSTSRTRTRKQSLDSVHHIESTNAQQNYTLLHTTQASNSQATSTDDSTPCVVSTANLIPVTLVLCTDGATAKGQEVTVAQKEDGIELQCQPPEGDLGVDGIQYVAYSTAEQERTSLETGLSGGVVNQEVVSEVEREEVVPPSLNTRSRRKRPPTGRSETPRAKK